MRTTAIARTTIGLSLLIAPTLGLVSAFFGDAAVKTDSHAELAAIAAHPNRFYLYAITQLVGAYLLIPAFLGIKNMMRERSPRWADLAGGAVLLGLLIAIGDGAVELMYWQMGTHTANLDQMAQILDAYGNAPGSSLPYAIGGIILILGTIAFAIGLSVSRTVPIWAALTIPASIFTNILGFAAGSQPLLIVSAVLLLAGFWRIAVTVLRSPTLVPAVTPDAQPATA
jgi:hypothetical protein